MKTEKRYCVYMHTNKENGKRYVGMTSLRPNKRFQGGSGYTHQEEFWRDIQTYGWEDGFTHDILFEDLSKEEAQIREIETIAKYNSDNPEFGYNRYTSSRAAKLSNIREVQEMNGVNNKVYTGVRRPIYCVELNKIFDSAVAAGKELNLNNSHISEACKKLNKRVGGYHFRFVNYTKNSVYCFETNDYYTSTGTAAVDLGLSSARIKRVCDGLAQTTGKMHFRYITEEELAKLIGDEPYEQCV